MKIPGTRFIFDFPQLEFNYENFIDLVQTGGRSQFDFIKETEEWNYELIKDSITYEGENWSYEDQLQKIFDYLQSVKIPNIKTLHQLISPKHKFIRDKFIQIEVKETYQGIKCNHVGINSKFLDEEELQNLVNFYYENRSKLPPYFGFICYMFYQRLHPSEDGNGRLGRLIFLENKMLNTIYPLSSLLKGLSIQEEDQIYKIFNYPKFMDWDNYTDEKWSEEPEDQDKYFTLKLTEDNIKTILRLLIFSILYKFNKNNEKLLNYMKNPYQKNKAYKQQLISNFQQMKQIIDNLQ